MFDRDKILLDPYAKSVFFPPTFDRFAAVRHGSNAGKAPLGVLMGDSERFDWQGDQRPRHEADTVIYELHVGGFTKNPNSGVRDEARGTFAGPGDGLYGASDTAPRRCCDPTGRRTNPVAAIIGRN